MKILVTGVTKLHCTEGHYLSQELKVVPSEVALLAALREMGHTVVQRPVKWGENLDEFDKIITYLSCTSQFTAKHTDGALWTLRDPNTLIAIDDWQFYHIYTNGTNPSTNGRKWVGGNLALDRQMNGYDGPQDVVDELHYDWCNNRRILLPAFEGGDLELMFAHMRKSKRWKDWFATQHSDLFSYNPNSWLPGRVHEGPGVLPEDRKCEWVVAGLRKAHREHMTKRKLEWPVIELGGRGKQDVRMSEPEAIEWFGERWLHAISGYDHAGSGWWRSRPSQLAGHGVVSYCSPKEGAIYGPSWVIEDPKALEEMSVKELDELGQRQAAEFFERHPIDDKGKADAVAGIQAFIT